VIRASGGIFFAPGVTPRIDATGFTATPSFSSQDGFSPVYNWANSWPQNWAPPPNIDPSFANGQAVSYLPPNAARPPQTASWTFTVQKQLPGDIAVEAGYIGSKSTHLEIGSTLAAYLNVLNPSYLSLGNLLNQPIDSTVAKAAGYTAPFAAFTGLPMHTVGQSLRPYPQYANVNMPYSPEGISNYNALQLKIAKRYSEDLTFLAFYTRSKLMTNDDFAPIDLGEGPGNIQNPQNRTEEYSVSQDDYPNMFGVSFSYALPVGRGERWLRHRRLLRQLLGDWQIAGSIQRQSGTPLSITAGTALAQFGFPVIRADYINGENVYPANRGFDPARDFYLNSAAFSAPAAFRFGNTGRVLNWVRGPGVASEALSIERKISLTERFDTTLRMDAINPFNFVRWTNPNTNITDANFGSINAARPGRVVQISLKVSF
jgi:hypothetical protein